ncbi:hypothetical protein Tco_0856871 [Tanacetum coccineum]|uniref:Uncharacterized protein n=1 Tax=Tanacetum coccineum TaxID=301880 RepID=A0ABQ5B6E1_9ASTR
MNMGPRKTDVWLELMVGNQFRPFAVAECWVSYSICSTGMSGIRCVQDAVFKIRRVRILVIRMGKIGVLNIGNVNRCCCTGLGQGRRGLMVNQIRFLDRNWRKSIAKLHFDGFNLQQASTTGTQTDMLRL